MSVPKVSIGMPVYNGGKLFKRAVQSLLAQTFTDFEFIISDNASDDGTWEVLQEFAKQDQRIIPIRQKENIGMVKNWHFSFKEAKGRYFMWAAADDCWEPEFIQRMIQELEEHPDADVSMSATKMVDANGRSLREERFVGRDNPNANSHFRMMLAVTSMSPVKTKNGIRYRIASNKLSLYFHGLYRVELLRQLVKYFVPEHGVDRWLISFAAISVRLRYVDEILYIRTLHEKDRAERNINDEVCKLKTPTSDIAVILMRATANLIRGSMVPLKRKIYAPIAGYRLLRMYYHGRRKQRAKLRDQTITVK